MSNFSHFELFCWVAGLIGHATLLFVIFIRKHARTFPVFTFYLAYKIVETAWWYVISLSGTPQQQYAASIKVLITGYVVELAFLSEIAFHVMRATKVIVKQAFIPFLICSLVCVSIARYASGRMAPNGVSGMALWDLRFTYFALIITSFTYTFLVTATNLSCLPWRSHVASIGEGFSVWLISSTAMDGLHAMLGWKSSDRLFDNISKTVYLATLVYWTVRLWFPERNGPSNDGTDLEHNVGELMIKMGLAHSGSSRYGYNTYRRFIDTVGRRKRPISTVEGD